MNEFYFLDDGDLRPITELKTDSSNLVVYEVIRFVNGVPLFFDDHYARLLNSLSIIGKTVFIDDKFLLEKLLFLANRNKIEEGNLMLQLILSSTNYRSIAWFIPFKYPNNNDYVNGVKTDLLFAERTNPEAKIVNSTIRQRANEKIEKLGVYEVLLVDHNKCVCEGSRSNFFAIKNNKLFTAPLSKVLKGITLLKVLEIAKTEHIPVVFTDINYEDINKYDALFLTGTSPKILPISMVGETHFDVSNKLLQLLTFKYNKLIDIDIKKRDNQSHP